MNTFHKVVICDTSNEDVELRALNLTEKQFSLLAFMEEGGYLSESVSFIVVDEDTLEQV